MVVRTPLERMQDDPWLPGGIDFDALMQRRGLVEIGRLHIWVKFYE